MFARYDLSKYPACFNFLEFLGAAKTYGASHVDFVTANGIINKYDLEQTQERIETILLPCCRIFGVEYSFDTFNTVSDGLMIDPNYHVSALLSAHAINGTIGKVDLYPYSPIKGNYSITLRNSKRFPFRNSNILAWEKFANQIGARIIPDYDDDKTISLIQKTEIWSKSQLNFFVNNGPAMVAYLSNYNYMSFFKWHHVEYHNYHGFPEGSQFPWAHNRQEIIWKNDDYDTLMYHFEKYYESGGNFIPTDSSSQAILS